MVLSHLKHFLQIINNAKITNNSICYNLDLFIISVKNNHNLIVNIEIPININIIWKNIYKSELTKKYMELDNELNNFLDFGYLSNIPIALQGQFIPIITLGFIFNTMTLYFLNAISPNNNFNIICNKILLLLLLNQLQQLIVDGILD